MTKLCFYVMISVLYFIIQYKKPFTILLLAGTVKPRMES